MHAEVYDDREEAWRQARLSGNSSVAEGRRETLSPVGRLLREKYCVGSVAGTAALQTHALRIGLAEVTRLVPGVIHYCDGASGSPVGARVVLLRCDPSTPSLPPKSQASLTKTTAL